MWCGDDQSPEGKIGGYSRCPICLERIRNVAFLNPCFHRFCFVCILEWSERKAECPLCNTFLCLPGI
uniref:RING-type E3 ubiquitin transferase n=1 Tax=Salvator merianae TaxID=96440 RepID=A0A8D0E6H5_SALMN